MNKHTAAEDREDPDRDHIMEFAANCITGGIAAVLAVAAALWWRLAA